MNIYRGNMSISIKGDHGLDIVLSASRCRDFTVKENAFLDIVVTWKHHRNFLSKKVFIHIISISRRCTNKTVLIGRQLKLCLKTLTVFDDFENHFYFCTCSAGFSTISLHIHAHCYTVNISRI